MGEENLSFFSLVSSVSFHPPSIHTNRLLAIHVGLFSETILSVNVICKFAFFLALYNINHYFRSIVNMKLYIFLFVSLVVLVQIYSSYAELTEGPSDNDNLEQ
jgi:hypothetical protein